MFSGILFRKINLDFISSHHIFNKLAYKHLFRKESQTFPSLERIQQYSGVLGPDGLWWNGHIPSSHHVYNPLTQEGNALTQVDKHYDMLVSTNRVADWEKAARSAAYLSHFIVDALDPAHHTGRKKHTNSHDDWDDPYLPHMRFFMLRNFLHKHFLFEFFSGSYLFLKQKWYLRRIFRFRKRRTKSQLLFLLNRRIRYVYRLGMYERFFQKQYEDQAKKQILFILFPMMISSVAQFWWCAWKQSLRTGLRHKIFVQKSLRKLTRRFSI